MKLGKKCKERSTCRNAQHGVSKLLHPALLPFVLIIKNSVERHAHASNKALPGAAEAMADKHVYVVSQRGRRRIDPHCSKFTRPCYSNLCILSVADAGIAWRCRKHSIHT